MTTGYLANCGWGADLQTALTSDFFTFFHLRVAQTTETPQRSVLTYRPESKQFRTRVAVTLTMDGSGRFHAASLELDRSVIDDSMSDAQARDIVKSFIANALPQSDLEGAKDWVLDIMQRDSEMERLVRGAAGPEEFQKAIMAKLAAGQPVSVVGGGKGFERRAEGPATEGFLVFSGQQKECELALDQSRLRLANHDLDGKLTLQVSVAPSA